MPKANPNITIGKGEGDGPLRIVIYGPPGVGKSTQMAAQLPEVLLLDCAGGLRYIAGYKWAVNSASDLKEAVAFLSKKDNGFLSVVLDGVDALYASMTQREGDRRQDHLKQQDVLHPLLEALFRLPHNLAVVLNDHADVTQEGNSKVQKVSFSLDLPPRTTELLMARADFVLRFALQKPPKGGQAVAYATWTDAMVKARHKQRLVEATSKGGVKLSELVKILGVQGAQPEGSKDVEGNRDVRGRDSSGGHAVSGVADRHPQEDGGPAPEEGL